MYLVQVIGQDEVKKLLSDQIQYHMEQLHFWGRCQANPRGPVWRDLLDSLAELLTHHLQQVSLAA